MKQTKEELNKTISSLKEQIKRLENQQSAKVVNALGGGVKVEFLSHMSHELRTPVNLLLNAVDMLREDYIKDPDDYAKEILSILDNAGSRIHRTIDLFVHLIELHTGSYRSEKSHFNLFEDIKHTLYSQFKSLANNKDIGFYWVEEGNKHLVETDAYAVTQIFIQLIDNAIKFTNFGKVEITVKNEKGLHLLSVADTGVGMNEDFLPKIFDPFLQEDSGYARMFEGNGLGLTIAKLFADIINADILVESEKGIGSTFTVTFDNN